MDKTIKKKESVKKLIKLRKLCHSKKKNQTMTIMIITIKNNKPYKNTCIINYKVKRTPHISIVQLVNIYNKAYIVTECV